MLMAHKARRDAGEDQERFNSILREFYNIDRLLSVRGLGPERRPPYPRLLEILIAAAKGDFSPYRQFRAGRRSAGKEAIWTCAWIGAELLDREIRKEHAGVRFPAREIRRGRGSTARLGPLKS